MLERIDLAMYTPADDWDVFSSSVILSTLMSHDLNSNWCLGFSLYAATLVKFVVRLAVKVFAAWFFTAVSKLVCACTIVWVAVDALGRDCGGVTNC